MQTGNASSGADAWTGKMVPKSSPGRFIRLSLSVMYLKDLKNNLEIQTKYINTNMMSWIVYSFITNSSVVLEIKK